MPPSIRFCVRVAANVARSAKPIAPPTWAEVLTRPEASPASCGVAPDIASITLGDIASNAGQSAFAIKIHGELARLDSAGLAVLVTVNIVPALLVENIDHKRRTEQEPNLIARLTRLELGNQLLRQDVALLDVDLVFIDEAWLV